MRIHLPSGTIHPTDDSAYSNGQYCYRILSGYKAEPIESIAWADWDIYPFAYPVVPDGYKQTSNVVLDGDSYTYEVVAKTAEELAEEKQQYINQVFDAAENYVDIKGGQSKGRISKYSIGVLTMKAAGNKPKSKANNDWVNAVFTLAYTREAQLNGGVPFDASMLDFSSAGQMPYTVAECLVE